MTPPAAEPAIDPVVTAVIANRIDGIVREMTNTLLRAARSAVIVFLEDGGRSCLFLLRCINSSPIV